MIEIVFNESAAGSLKQAMGYGRGRYPGGATAVILGSADGSAASPEEIEAARQAFEARQEKEWEEAVPLGGSAADVLCFGLALSYGDISEENFWEKRRDALMQLSAFWPEDAAGYVDEALCAAQKRMDLLLKRCGSESVRIWFSDQADEACGLHWMLAELRGKCADIRIVKLPAYEVRGDEMREYSSWGEVAPGDWRRFLDREERLAPVQLQALAARWRELQAENMSLRAVIGGRLCGVRDDLYDHFIRREIAAAEPEFMQARVIGNVLGRHCRGVSDCLVALRMEEIIRNGEIAVVQAAGVGEPAYRRILRRNA